MTNTEKLVSIFTPEFVRENADLATVDAICQKVAELAPEISKEEVVEFLTAVSQQMDKTEMSEDDLENVAGGIGLLAIAGGIVAVCGVFGATYAVGTAIGKCIRNIRG